MELKLYQKFALVTGASKGIGKAIALRLGRSGADVAVNYNTDKNGGETVADMIRQMGRSAIAIQADVSKSDQVEFMIERATGFFGERLDILVNNAGIVEMPKAVVETRNEDWDRVLDTNLKGVFYVSRAAAKKMIKSRSKGRIISLASGAGMTAGSVTPITVRPKLD